jgi:peroxiredoxin Q/BCP
VEACGFRDAISQIQELGAVLLGASVDDIKTQRSFAEKFDVPYKLLSDTERALSRAYGVLSANNSSGRSTYLIDSGGVIRKVWPKVTPAGHALEILKALRSL